jgi:hypothetical protein
LVNACEHHNTHKKAMFVSRIDAMVGHTLCHGAAASPIFVAMTMRELLPRPQCTLEGGGGCPATVNYPATHFP